MVNGLAPARIVMASAPRSTGSTHPPKGTTGLGTGGDKGQLYSTRSTPSERATAIKMPASWGKTLNPGLVIPKANARGKVRPAKAE
jgi:hypothetical protein